MKSFVHVFTEPPVLSNVDVEITPVDHRHPVFAPALRNRVQLCDLWCLTIQLTEKASHISAVIRKTRRR